MPVELLYFVPKILGAIVRESGAMVIVATEKGRRHVGAKFHRVQTRHHPV
jgi:hypothetical protein